MRTKFGVSIIFATALAAALPSHSMAQSSSGSVRQAPAAAPSTEQAQISQPPQGVNWQGVGVGAGTLAANVVYIPAKLVYGILGGIGGGAGYALTGGNQQVANTIWRSSLGGDYVVTPDMLTGKQALHFSGPTETEPSAANAPVTNRVASAPAGAGVPAATSSGGTSASYTNSSAMMAPATHPMDSGAGPIRGSTLSSTSIGSSGSGSLSGSGASKYAAPKSASSSARPVVPDTSIE